MTERLPELLRGQRVPLTDADADAFRACGMWPNRTLRSVLSDAAIEFPDRVAVVGRRSQAPTARQTYRELDAAAHHAAEALASVGVGTGDAVALMLPNWIEYTALVFGINELGAIYAGTPVASGARHAAAILRRSKAKVLVIPRAWRSTDHLELSMTLRAELPDLETVIVLDDDPAGLRDGEVLWSSLAGAPHRDFEPPHPGRICYLGFTSGTTGEPKGAMHTHHTLLYCAQALVEHVGPRTFGDPMVQLVASPAGHHTGFTWGILFTVYLAGTAVHVDKWDATWGIEVIRKEGVTAFFGAPTFLQDMMRTDLVDDPACPLECLVIAGSPVPRTLPARARRAFGAYIAPAWGLTECGIMSCCTPAEPDDILRTDGSIFAGSAVRVVDAHGNERPARRQYRRPASEGARHDAWLLRPS
jgi:cyclohexanecarboxylate-CoA ligase